VQLALAGDFVPYAVNVAAGEVSNAVRPFMGLAEVLGRFIGGLLDGKPADLEVTYLGELAARGPRSSRSVRSKVFSRRPATTGSPSSTRRNWP